jgi:hypothetical protein
VAVANPPLALRRRECPHCIAAVAIVAAIIIVF